jgi:2-oxoglutarate dehydrogenase E1 component
VLIDQSTGHTYTALKHLRKGQGIFSVYDSLLSEFAVLGFEYGYSVSRPGALVLWEAQFGDFVNGAQIVIDNFISSAEEKWGQESSLVLLLPHGYEGQGPEHSSARLERFLSLCAKKNMRVAMPTTAAQYFHLLRRQVHQSPRKPLVLMTPKSLLRAPSAKSRADDFVTGKCHLILDDRARNPSAKTLLLCSGKIAYDLMDFRDRNGINGVAIIRLEQLYPFPADDFAEILRRYPDFQEVKWVQEEPRNMGAWRHMLARLRGRLPDQCDISFAGRPPSGSPATGSQSVHSIEHEHLIQQAFSAS